MLNVARTCATLWEISQLNDRLYDVQGGYERARIAPVGLGVLDCDLRFLNVDSTLATLHGRPAADHRGQPLSSVLPTLAPAIEPLLRHVLSTGEPILDADVRGDLPDGRMCRWLASYYPVRTRAGLVIAVECTVRALDQVAPFSALGTAPARPQAGEERFRTIQELSLDGLSIMHSVRDESGEVVDFACEYLNPVAEQLVGQPLATLYGRRMTEFFPGARSNGLLAQYLRVFASGEPQVFEQHYEGDGIDAWYRNMVIRLGGGLAIVFSDITAQKQTEEALRASEERFRQFAEAVEDVFWISDPAEHRLLYVSPAYAQLMGRSREALYVNYLEWIEAIHPEDRERVASAFFERIYQGTYEEEFRIVRPDGGVRWVRDRGFPIWDATGKVYRAAGIAEDITQRKAHEAQIELQARMLDSVGQAVIATDPEGMILYWNHGAEELYGWAGAEVRGRSAIEVLVAEPDRDQAAEVFATLRQGSSWTGEFSLRRHDGSRLEVLATDAPIYDQNGVLIGFIGTAVDITRRKRAEAERIRLLEFTTALAEALTPPQVAAVIFEHVHQALGAQAGIVSLLSEDGQSLEVLETRGYPPEVLARWPSLTLDMPIPLAEAARSGQPLWVETQAEIAARFPALLEALPMIAAGAVIPLRIQQRVIGVLGVNFAEAHAFTEDDRVYLQVVAHQCAQALDRAWLYESEHHAHLAAEEAVRMRDELIELISHDLRNPLTVILGQAELMVKQAKGFGDLGMALVPRLTVIRNMVSQMDGQLEELLDVARIRAGQTLFLNPQPMDLVELVREVVRATQATSSKHEIDLTIPAAPIFCLGDRRRLARVFANLIHNAIVYSPSGGAIGVAVSQVSDDAGSWGLVSVQDSGLGIPAADLPRVFERFHRGSNVAGRIRGTGLGLASARQIVEQHEGSIQVASVEGIGSTFIVRLPAPGA